MRRFLWVLCVLVLLTGCQQANENTQNEQILKKIDSLKLEYASQFCADYYEEGYIHVSVKDGTDYVIVPADKKENSLGLENPVYIHRPCDKIYLAASSAMDLFLAIDELDNIAVSSTKSKDYAMEAVRNAMDEGKIAYAGKYSAPDYELLLENGCNLAIESTMILHAPKIKEQLNRIGIPVFIERSSYEENPIGRLEWVKLYGILTDQETVANAFFQNEMDKINELLNTNQEKNQVTDNAKKVAFFSISSGGYVTVRKPGDYICEMIEMAGGKYALDNLLVEEENALSTINIGMEDFYREAKDADILIYNGTIDGGVETMEAFCKKNELLSKFTAVSEGNVWSTNLNMYQESSKIVEVIRELSDVINEDERQKTSYQFLKHLE